MAKKIQEKVLTIPGHKRNANQNYTKRGEGTGGGAEGRNGPNNVCTYE
jgi:hypothetical protein